MRDDITYINKDYMIQGSSEPENVLESILFELEDERDATIDWIDDDFSKGMIQGFEYAISIVKSHMGTQTKDGIEEQLRHIEYLNLMNSYETAIKCIKNIEKAKENK